jgi:hypothetical protein
MYMMNVYVLIIFIFIVFHVYVTVVTRVTVHRINYKINDTLGKAIPVIGRGGL